MSGLDVVSGVAGLLSLAIQVTEAITKYAVAVKDYPQTMKDLSNELQTLGHVLSKLKEFILSEEKNGRSFEGDSMLVKSISDCNRRIERIGDKLKSPDRGKISRTIDRLKWPFEQKDVIQQIENLRRYIQIFEFAVTIKNSEFLSKSWDEARKSLQDLQNKVEQSCETNRMMGEPIDKLLRKSQQLQQIIDIIPILLQQTEDIKEISQVVRLNEQRAQERRVAEILEWLVPLSDLHKHIKVQERRAPGTCKWLLQNDIFQEWSRSDDQQYDVVCRGGPGVGKTVLSSSVIDHLRVEHKDADIAVVYYYFDLAEQQRQTEENLIRSILRQLCQSTRTIPAGVADFYQRTRNELKDSLWLQELQEILQRVIATFSQCFIIIDAFDETEAKKRKGLIEVLQTIKSSTTPIKFFVTSRPHVNLEPFNNAIQVEVRANEDDLRICLGQKIDVHERSVDIIDSTLKEYVLNKLCSHANGVFLLPSLLVDQILDQAVSAGDVERALQDVSTDLKEVFQTTIIRIESYTGARRSLAFKTLMWLSHAKRPLKIMELQHALAVRLDGDDLHPRDVSSPKTILDSCCSLIEIEPQTSVVRFVHGSIAEYLREKDHGFFKDADLDITNTCLKYLAMQRIGLSPEQSRPAFLKMMSDYPLLEYASSFWGFHATGLEVQTYSALALPALTDYTSLFLMTRARDLNVPEIRKWKDKISAWAASGGAGISVAVGFGLTDLTRLLISQTQAPMINAKNIYGSTPLHQAAILGYKETAELLIAHNADLMDSNHGKATPFYLAVSYGHLHLCRTLLQYGRDQVNVACKEQNTALHKAVDFGSEEMVQFLIQSGAVVGVKNQQGMAPMHLAARRGHLNIMRMLVLSGADPQAEDVQLLTPLDLAVLGSHLDVVEYLLQQGVNVNHKNRENWTALHRAARVRHSEIIKRLLAAGAHVMAEDGRRTTPFHLATKSGSLESMKAIFEYDPSLIPMHIRHQDKKGDTATTIAFYTAHYDVFRFLRKLERETLSGTQRVTINPVEQLHDAIENGALSQVQYLLQIHPHWLTVRDEYEQMALHTAFRTQQKQIAEYLLSLGASINSRGYHGWTPLQIAAQIGSLSMTELALSYNADIFAVTRTFQTVLHKVASSRSTPVLLELLRCGCNPGALNNTGMTAVHVAARHNFGEGIQIMTQPQYGGRNLLSSRDKNGRTPRDWAARSGHFELSRSIRNEERRGGNARIRNNNHDARNRDTTPPAPSQLSRISRSESLTNTLAMSSSITSLPLHTHLSRESTMSLASSEDGIMTTTTTLSSTQTPASNLISPPSLSQSSEDESILEGRTAAVVEPA